MKKLYTAIVRTADGGSAFEDGALSLEERVVARALPPIGVAQLSLLGRVLFLSSRPFESEPHPAPRRQWVLPLRGVLDVAVSNGTRRRFVAGDLVLVADTSGRGHATWAIGEPPLEALWVPVE